MPAFTDLAATFPFSTKSSNKFNEHFRHDFHIAVVQLAEQLSISEKAVIEQAISDLYDATFDI